MKSYPYTLRTLSCLLFVMAFVLGVPYFIGAPEHLNEKPVVIGLMVYFMVFVSGWMAKAGTSHRR